MASTLNGTRSAGDALKDLNYIHVLIYDENQNLLNIWNIEKSTITITEEARNNIDAENGHTAEANTKRASFKLPKRINFGKYYIYAVANFPSLDTPQYSEAIKTIDGLKSLPLKWDSSNLANNGQMIGTLSNGSTQYPTPPSAETGDEHPSVIADKLISIDNTQTQLYGWLLRAASKVTVAFDGTRLKDGVSIFLKSVRIKNIPASCLLGKKNTVKGKKDPDTGKEIIADESMIIQTGEEVVYSESTVYDSNYPALITKNRPYYPGIKKTDETGHESWEPHPDRHSETNVSSLFFYENMQGQGPDKQQSDDQNNDGILDSHYEYKEKPNATYIEVEAYYESTVDNRPGICNITYRFMLGQNISTDYDAKRNCHYKLTLCFNGYADDPDWRIDYVTRLWATQPKTVDYRGKYFVDDGSSNGGHTFKDDNSITVTSYMYNKDSWFDRIPQEYKITYKDAGSLDFTTSRPSWLGEFTEVGTEEDAKNGIYKLKINYNNPYTPQDINATLQDDNRKKTAVYDLSTKGGKELRNTANSYIVDSKGTYIFPLVYGNAITNGADNIAAYTYREWIGDYRRDQYLINFINYKNEKITKPYILEDIAVSPNSSGLSASLVWQDEPGLVSDIIFNPNLYEGKGGIQFTVGNQIKEGNAVIALKDKDGIIIWSWQIWVTAFDLSRIITLTNNKAYDSSGNLFTSGDLNFEIMPVNLGWCSGGISVRYYDRHECEVKFTQIIGKNEDGTDQYGLSKTVKIIQEPHIAIPRGNNPYYQWGRKDPFIAGGNGNGTSKEWYDAEGIMHNSAPELMYTGDDDSRILAYKAIASLIQNPDKWQNGPREKVEDQFQSRDHVYFNLWDNRLGGGDDNVIKTIYDPCPVGFHVSPISTFTGFTDTGANIGSNWDVNADITKGMYAAVEKNMMPISNENDRQYITGIFEFYTNKTKLISIGFPVNGYRDYDDNAKLLKYDQGEGQIWLAQAVKWDWGLLYSVAYHFEYNRTYPHIWPWNTFFATDGFAVRPTRLLPR